MSNSAAAPKLLLASQSPRRQEILQSLGLSFSVRPAHLAEEELMAAAGSLHPRAYAMRLAYLKGAALADELKAEGAEGDHLIISADTIVIAEGNRILNKPADTAAAITMLTELSGRTHEVMTALSLRRSPQGDSYVHTARTRVTFLPMTPEGIAAYAATGSPLDKAGGYGVQDHSRAHPFVQEVGGDYWNVVGLPVVTLLDGLEQFGLRHLATRPVPVPPPFDPPIAWR